jgi:hypothetical protein
MHLLKTRLPFLLLLSAIYLTACSSGPQVDSFVRDGVAPGDIGMSEDDCAYEAEPKHPVCFTAIDAKFNCQTYSDSPSLYRKCEMEVNYSLQSNFERSSSIEVKCEAKVDYVSRFGLMRKSEPSSSRHALDPQGAVSGAVDFEFRFSRNRRVTEVKDSVECKLVSTYEY